MNRPAHGGLEMEPMVGTRRMAPNVRHVDDALLELSPNNHNQSREGRKIGKKVGPAVPDPASYIIIARRACEDVPEGPYTSTACTLTCRRSKRAPPSQTPLLPLVRDTQRCVH